MECVCLVHYHEIGLKGHNRNTFERRLRDNLAEALSAFDAVRVERISGHLLVSFGSDADVARAAELLRQVPGVARTSSALALRTHEQGRTLPLLHAVAASAE